jgi:CspA family cold shock protein
MPDAPARRRALIPLTGTMKWFDATRGFGFLVSDEIEGDVLVHFSVLKEHDRRSLPEGAVVECLVARQERGLQARGCCRSISAMRSSPMPRGRAPRRRASGSTRRPCSTRPAPSSRCGSNGSTASRAMASWSATRTTSQDIFVHMETVRRGGLTDLAPDQPLRARIAMGRKGPLAVEVEPD